MTTTDVYTELVDAILAVADPEMIVLFGSRARGDVHDDSDIDLMVVAEKDKWRIQSKRLETVRLQSALPDIDDPVDLLLYTPKDMAEWRDSLNHIIGDAIREGRVLYERCSNRS